MVLDPPAVVVPVAAVVELPVHLAAEPAEPVQLLGDRRIRRPHDVAHALDQQPHAAGHVVLPPRRVVQRALAAIDGARDVVDVHPHVAQVVPHVQHLRVRLGLRRGQLVLLPRKARDLQGERLPHLQDPRGELADRLVEEVARHGHHLPDALGKVRAGKHVHRPDPPADRAHLHQRGGPASAAGLRVDDDGRRRALLVLRQRVLQLRVELRLEGLVGQQRLADHAVRDALVAARDELVGRRGDRLEGRRDAVVARQEDEGAQAQGEPLPEGRRERPLREELGHDGCHG
mmetsp:Transcript_21812/g.51422  ORF Transcript_21812/g.51422 Transcript_21812/m.51422 type:complete len:288 (-) Transcript_21812:377-1240(-)